MVTIAQLVRAVDPALVPANAHARTPWEITGVHISELADPTPFLEGGEMLLTTGMALTDSATRCVAYVDRLSRRGVRALVLGLGPTHGTIPEALVAACDEATLPLLLVPIEHAFRTVTAGYWALVAEDGRAGLVQQIGTQTSVVRAALGSDGAAGVIKLVAQSLGTWAAYFPFTSAPAEVWPPAATGVAPALRDELGRFAQRGDVGAATFPLHGYEVIAFPIGRSDRAVAAFAVGTTQRLSRVDRQLLLTAAAALSLRDSVHDDAHVSARSIDGALAGLLLADEITAARALAAAVGAGPLPGSVRIFVSAPIPAAAGDGRSSTDRRPLTPDEEAILVELVDRRLVSASPTPLATRIGGCLVVLTEAALGSTIPDLASPPVSRELTGAMSEPTPLHGIREATALAARTARQAPAGQILVAGAANIINRGDGAATALRAYSRAPLVASVRAYLRHRGSWESAARDLGVHRNTVRSRIRIARETLGIDLDDPDLAAELWIALREGTPEYDGASFVG